MKLLNQIKVAIKTRIIAKSWPSQNHQLLLSAVLSKKSVALKSWIQWTHQNQLNDVTWEEHKLFSYFAQKIKWIDPHSLYRPRIEGLAKAHWTKSQIVLRFSSNAIQPLIEHGIDVMVLKGAALMILLPMKLGPRITADLDIMVKRADFEKAINILYGLGWQTTSDSVESAKLRWRFDSGINLNLGLHGDIDIHHQPFKGPILDENVLSSLWSKATKHDFNGYKVFVPSAEDLLVMISVHATQFDKNRSGAWAIDLLGLIDASLIDAKKMVQSAQNFMAVPEVIATLSFLQKYSKHVVIKKTLSLLDPLAIHWRAWLLLYVKSTKLPDPIFKRLNQFLNLPRPILYEKDVIPKIHPHFFLRHTTHSMHAILNDTFKARHDFQLPKAETKKRWMIIDIAFVPLSYKKYRFDVIQNYSHVSRLSIFAFKNQSLTLKRYRFKLPLKDIPTALSIESCSKHKQKGTLERINPPPFKVVKLSWG